MTVRDETSADIEPDVWLIWNDADYYGPHWVGICRTEEDAVAFVTQLSSVEVRRPNGSTYHPNDMRDLYIEGVKFDGPAEQG
jgi:hypothetical protein